MPPPEEDIRRTLARYCMLCDDGRFAELAALFTEGGRLHALGETRRGHEEICAFMEHIHPPELRGKHLGVNSVIESDGWAGTAAAWTDFVFVGQDRGVVVMGRYHDHLVREGDKVWRFDLREIVLRGDQPELTLPVPA